MNTLQRLYDSEINWEISTFWDGGFIWRLGDEHNGWKASGNTNTLEEAISALAEAARKHFPDSAFAKEQEIDFEELLAKMREIAKRDGLEVLTVEDSNKLCEAAKKELLQ